MHTYLQDRKNKSGHKTVGSYSNNIISNVTESINHLTDWKIEQEEEEKYDYHKSDHSGAKTDFMVPRSDDYMCCGGDIAKCNAIQRIVHLLEYYHNNRTAQSVSQNNDKQIVLLYEYIASLTKYTVPTFMEDWYHSKTKHFKTETDYEWFQTNKQINCNTIKSVNCIHIGRYQRQRGKETYDINNDIDYKNIILRDRIDSIHAFIFHTKSLCISETDNQHQYISSDNQSSELSRLNSTTEIVEEDETDIWYPFPSCIQECTMEQILYILNNGDVFNKLDKLKTHTVHIIKYMTENELDGSKLFGMKRKNFFNRVSEQLDDKKTKSLLGRLYSNIMNFNLSQYADNQSSELSRLNSTTEIVEEDETDIWYPFPSCIQECTMEQILYILNNGDVFNKLDKLKTHTVHIIKYMTENELDGSKLFEMKRKNFLNRVSAQLGDKKTKLSLGRLYSNIMNFNLSQYDISWYNHPTAVKDCSMEQVLYVLKHERILDGFDKLTHFKQDIIQYIKDNNMDGNKLMTMKTNDFINHLSEHLNNSKLRGQLDQLYTSIKTMDVQKYYEENSDLESKHKKVDIVVNSSKYMTSPSENNDKQKNHYYSFGEQYRYTDHFKKMRHPLFVPSIYASIKEE
eukprot:99699_1